MSDYRSDPDIRQKRPSSQLKWWPTRQSKLLLDLLFTSHPGHVERCKTLPPIGNNDHDILMVDISTNAYKPRPTRRKIFLWKKTDLENMGKQLDTEFSKFNTTEFKDINSMWSSIKQLITNMYQQKELLLAIVTLG